MTPVPVGIVTPVLTAVPGMHSEWETSADVASLVDIVQCADRLGFDVVLPVGPLDPLGSPGITSERIAQSQEAGATRVAASIRSSSPAHYCDQLHALAERPETAAG